MVTMGGSKIVARLAWRCGMARDVPSQSTNIPGAAAMRPLMVTITMMPADEHWLHQFAVGSADVAIGRLDGELVADQATGWH